MKKPLKSFIKLWALLENKDKKQAYFILFLMVFGTFLELLGIGFVIPIFAIIGDEQAITQFPVVVSIVNLLGKPAHHKLVIYVMLFLLFIYIIKSVFLAYSSYRQSNFIYRFSAKVSSKLFKLFLVQPYPFHLWRNSSELIRIVSNDVSMLASVVQSLTIILSEGFVLMGLFVFLVVVEPIGAVVSISILSLSALFFHLLTKSRIVKWGIENQFHGAKKFQHIQQGLSAAKDVKLLGREKKFIDIYNFHNVQIAELSEKQYTVSQLPRLFIELLAITGLIILVISMVLLGRDVGLILPTLALFAAAAFRLMPSVNRILSGVQTVQYALPSVITIHKELNELEISPEKLRGGGKSFDSEIIFENVSFSYEAADKVILKNISFKICKGESVGIIGGSGAGKSTVIDILLGLLRPISGFVKVDNVDIQEDLRMWQDQIGYVPQTIYLTDDSIRRNIAFGIPDEEIDEQRIQRAVRASQLEDFINSLEFGLNTEVGERGVRLSGGQRQRIGIARSLYHNPQVIVLDEATSSLDYDTERDVMESINALHGEKTIIIVAHRLNTIQNCDRILRFENGIISQEGTSIEVLKNMDTRVG